MIKILVVDDEKDLELLIRQKVQETNPGWLL
jgi:hypothetical protein